MEQFADIEGPVLIGWWPLALLITGIVLVVLLVLLAVYRLLKSNRKEVAVRRQAVRSPLEIALERLESLKSGRSSMAPEPFTVEVSDIVRDYLEEALEVPAREQTSEEFLGLLAAHEGMPDVLHQKMPGFLESCDRVKFARQSLDADQQDSLLVTARDVIESTDKEVFSPPSGNGQIAQPA